MTFAKIVFWAAGIWGILTVAPLYFIFNFIGQADPPPITHPGFFYGFAGVALAWQLAFFLIATNPVRLRPMMIAAVLEKWVWGLTVIVLYVQHRIRIGDAGFGCVDLLLGLLFAVAYLRTPSTSTAS